MSEPKGVNATVAQSHCYPRTRKILFKCGRIVDVINLADTPPPDEGFYRCNKCGRQVAIDKSKPYTEQSDHDDCPTGLKGQSMMGKGWCGWKAR